MSSVVAISVTLALYVAVVAVVIASYRAPRWRGPLLTAGAFLGLGLMGHYVGSWHSPDPRLFTISRAEALDASSPRCARIVSLLEQNKVVLDRSDPQRIVVNHVLWEQIPAQARDVVARCFKAPGHPDQDVKVVPG